MMISLSRGVTARERTDSVIVADDDGPLVVSIVTCEPGPDVYELCGHAALRIRDNRMDSVWNYGIFDFTSPNFIYRFCKGQTDYMVYGYNFSRFVPTYVRRGSRVTEQVLNLTQEEAQRLRSSLQTEALPQNREYRYNYVRDNCATRPWLRVNEAVEAGGRSIVMPDTLYFPSFRSEMRHFHRNYPWYQFGIDLALGGGLDQKLAKDEDTFAPPVLAAKIAGATIGGRPLVKETNVVFPGCGDVTLKATPWFLTPMAAGIVLLAAACIAFGMAYRRDSYWRWLISGYFILAGVAGCVLTFLVFVSEHEATSPNWLLLWLNPLQLIPGIGVWWRSWRTPVVWLAKYNIEMPLLMAAIGTCQWVMTATGHSDFVIQRLNPAAWPMMLAAIPLALTILYHLQVLKLHRNNK